MGGNFEFELPWRVLATTPARDANRNNSASRAVVSRVNANTRPRDTPCIRRRPSCHTIATKQRTASQRDKLPQRFGDSFAAFNAAWRQSTLHCSETRRNESKNNVLRALPDASAPHRIAKANPGTARPIFATSKMAGSPVSPAPALSPSSAPLLGLPADTLLQELTSSISSGIRSAMDTLLHAYSTQPNAPPASQIRTFLSDLLSTLQPHLQHELTTLSRTVSRAVLTLPPGVSETAVREGLAQARCEHDEKEERRVDEELAAMRAEIRAKEGERRHLEAVKERAERQVELLRAVGEKVKDGGAGKPLREAEAVIKAAEVDYASAVRILQEGEGGGLLEAARGAVGKKRTSDERLDEHGPLQCLLPGSGLLQAGGGATGVEELAVLRARLIG